MAVTCGLLLHPSQEKLHAFISRPGKDWKSLNGKNIVLIPGFSFGQFPFFFCFACKKTRLRVLEIQAWCPLRNDARLGWYCFLFPSLCLLGGILIGGGGTLRAVRLFGLAPPFSFSFQGRLGHQLDQCSHLLPSHPCFTETLSSFLQDGITVFREVLRKNLWKLHLLKNINLELKCKNNLRCRSPKHGPSWAIGFTSLTHQHLPTSALAERQGSIGRRRLQIASHP